MTLARDVCRSNHRTFLASADVLSKVSSVQFTHLIWSILKFSLSLSPYPVENIALFIGRSLRVKAALPPKLLFMFQRTFKEETQQKVNAKLHVALHY